MGLDDTETCTCSGSEFCSLHNPIEEPLMPPYSSMTTTEMERKCVLCLETKNPLIEKIETEKLGYCTVNSSELHCEECCELHCDPNWHEVQYSESDDQQYCQNCGRYCGHGNTLCSECFEEDD